MTADIQFTREQAIDHIWGLSAQVDGEFACSASESERLQAETAAALRVLGATEAEIDV